MKRIGVNFAIKETRFWEKWKMFQKIVLLIAIDSEKKDS